MVDETKPPRGWLTDEQMFGSSDDDDNAEVWREAQGASLSNAHRIAREEAAAYIAEELRAQADYWAQWGPGCGDVVIRLRRRADALDPRPLPGSEGR